MKTLTKYFAAGVGFLFAFLIIALIWIAELNYHSALKDVESSGAVTDQEIFEIMQQYGFKDKEAVYSTTGWERMKAIFN